MDSRTDLGYVPARVLCDTEIFELRACADSVERAIARGAGGHVRRVVVVAETASTQDTAAAVAGAESGVLVVAGRQSAGRGRLGRSWTQRGGLGIAATFALAVPDDQRPFLSLGVGVAVARAIEDALARDPRSAYRRIGLRWPNDVVEVAGGRKLAGVLIEARPLPGRAEPVFLIGVGINVGQGDGDWPAELAHRAVSLRQMGSGVSRAEVLAALVLRLDESLSALRDEPGRVALLGAWKQRDTLLGTRAEFVLGSAHVAGTVEGIEPTLGITIRQADGTTLRLPAATTSLDPGEGNRYPPDESAN